MSIPQTKTRTSHALAIKVNGSIVGLIQSFSYGLGRKVTPVFELNPETSGDPVDNVPGNVEGLTLSCERIDLFTSLMEEAFNGTDMNMLSDQTNPFQVYEIWNNPDGTTRMYLFSGCWFNKIDRKYDTTGDRIVHATGTMQYLRRDRIA